MAEKLQIGIYKLRNEIEELIPNKKPKTIDVDIKYLKSFFKEKDYKEQKVKADLSERFNLFLFYKKNKSDVKWKSFVENIAEVGEPILAPNKTTNESYVLLLENIITKKIYAVAGGFGYMTLPNIAEDDFGIEILSRLLKAEDKTLRSTKEKNLTGGVLGEVKVFRNDYNLNENDSFGNIYQEVHSSLNKKVLVETFGFDESELDSGGLCIAKNSFTIKKSITFERLLKIMENCEILIDTVQPQVDINGVVKVSRSKKVLLAGLESKVTEMVYYNYSQKTNNYQIDICHKEFDKYYYAGRYILEYQLDKKEIKEEYDEPIRCLSQVIESVLCNNEVLSDSELMELMNNARITSINNDGIIQTEDYVKNHYSTEIIYKEKNGMPDESYFYVDNSWYKIKPAFTNKINEQCLSFIDETLDSFNLENWNYPIEKENDFNSKHIDKPNFLVFDKFTPDNIEVCDILHWDSNNMYFFHVKAGFNNSMRDLSHQVSIAARRVIEDSKTGYSFIGKLYEKVKNNNGSSCYSKAAKKQFDTLPKKDFIDLFKNRKLTFVLAVLDTAQNKRSLKNINEFESNIAKYSLNELVVKMRTLGIDFKICEI